MLSKIWPAKDRRSSFVVRPIT